MVLCSMVINDFSNSSLLLFFLGGGGGGFVLYGH